MIDYHAMNEAAPEDVPEGARAVVVAFPDRTQHTYKLWIVDARLWTKKLGPQEAYRRLVAEGYKPSRARGKLAQARSKARGANANR